MKERTIAFLSGKGGTGKTFLTVNLASAAPSAIYIDCDVEEPNGHLFFRPMWQSSDKVCVPLPEMDSALCDGCRKCANFCAFNALAWANDHLLLFEELCHGCGGCLLVCPHGALRETRREIGEKKEGTSDGVRVLSGFLNPGEATGVPIIRALLTQPDAGRSVFIDCSPGSSCMVSESIRGADYCVLVAEPTRFGAHNLRMVHELLRLYKKPYGVVLNKCLPGEDPSADFCLAHGIPVLARISFDERLGLLNSNARIAAREDEGFREKFRALLLRIEKEACDAAVGHS